MGSYIHRIIIITCVNDKDDLLDLQKELKEEFPELETVFHDPRFGSVCTLLIPPCGSYINSITERDFNVVLKKVKKKLALCDDFEWLEVTYGDYIDGASVDSSSWGNIPSPQHHRGEL